MRFSWLKELTTLAPKGEGPAADANVRPWGSMAGATHFETGPKTVAACVCVHVGVRMGVGRCLLSTLTEKLHF